MKLDATSPFDRESSAVYDYMEARIQALKRRIMELEAENAILRHDPYANVDFGFVASA